MRRRLASFACAGAAVASDGLLLEDVRLRPTGPAAEEIPVWVARREGVPHPPVVVCLHGSGRDRDLLMEATYRYDAATNRLHGWARELARRGFATVALTQRCYGGRRGDMREWAKTELLFGRTAMGGLVEDVLCTVDYLRDHCPWASRARLGVTGLSLGGIVAFYAGVVDPRLEAVAPVCGGVGSLRALVDHGHTEYHSTYYYVPGLLGVGDHAELLAGLAPRALLVVGAEDDPGMPADALRALALAGARCYAAAGAAEAFAVRLRAGGHALLPGDLDELAAWFAQRLAADAA